MQELEKWRKVLDVLPAPVMRMLEDRVRNSPKVRAKMDEEDRKLAVELEKSMKPYHGRFDRHQKMPAAGLPREAILSDLRQMSESETGRWEKGYVSGGIYHGAREHVDFLNQVYALHSQSNPLHSDLFPSASKFEAEIVSMVAGILGAGDAAPEVCGTVNSGGTESILLAMRVYRDRARRLRGVTRPELVLPITAHTAFDKAGQYFNIKLRRIPLGPDGRPDLAKARSMVNRNTIAIVGSAPTFPHGLVDPIEELSELAYERGIGFHTDACLGGFILPFARELGYPVPKFDFSLRGVTSISADTHKYGYAAKGTSVLLYRTPELRREQFFTATDWPGGLYMSPTILGSRPGALSAQAWASILSIGHSGYREAARSILETAKKIREGIAAIPGLEVIGDPLWILAFRSRELDVYRVMDQMSHRQWNLNGLHKPECVHIAITLRHVQPGVAERFLKDLAECVEEVRSQPKQEGGMAPVYGMAANLPFRGLVADILKKTLETLYKP